MGKPQFQLSLSLCKDEVLNETLGLVQQMMLSTILSHTRISDLVRSDHSLPRRQLLWLTP